MRRRVTKSALFDHCGINCICRLEIETCVFCMRIMREEYSMSLLLDVTIGSTFRAVTNTLSAVSLDLARENSESRYVVCNTRLGYACPVMEVGNRQWAMRMHHRCEKMGMLVLYCTVPTL